MIACYDHQNVPDSHCPDCQFLTDFATWPQVDEDAHAREVYLEEHYANGSTMPDEAPELWSEFKRSFWLPVIGVDVR